MGVGDGAVASATPPVFRGARMSQSQGATAAVRFRHAGEVRIGRLEGDRVVDAGPSGPRGFEPTAEAWEALAAASGDVRALDELVLLPPVAPGKVICIGLNYRDHAEESGAAIPPVPIVFSKYPSCLIAHGEEIVLPREETRPDYEAELAVVVGRTARRVEGDAAVAAVGAYTAFNDVSGRRAQLETPGGQWVLGKSFDTFGPIGPALVRSEGVDLGNLQVRSTVSGETMQDSNTSNLIFGIAELVAYVSMATTLEPGDVIATGTPGGVGDGRDPKRYLGDGDVVEIDVEGAPTLRNPVAAER